MYQDKTKKLCLSGLFTAVIFVTTAYFFHIPVGANGGYLHFGDAFVYLAGSFLPAPYAMAAGAVGAGLSDALSPGGIIWLPATVVIKSLVALCFTSQCKTILCKRNYLALGGACILTLVGYYLAGAVLTGNAGRDPRFPATIRRQCPCLSFVRFGSGSGRHKIQSWL